MLRALGHVSRFLNRMMGGEAGQTLCARVAARFGPRCVFCRFVGAVLFDPDHCRKEIE